MQSFFRLITQDQLPQFRQIQVSFAYVFIACTLAFLTCTAFPCSLHAFLSGICVRPRLLLAVSFSFIAAGTVIQSVLGSFDYV